MAQWVEALVAKPDRLRWISGTHNSRRERTPVSRLLIQMCTTACIPHTQASESLDIKRERARSEKGKLDFTQLSSGMFKCYPWCTCRRMSGLVWSSLVWFGVNGRVRDKSKVTVSAGVQLRHSAGFILLG